MIVKLLSIVVLFMCTCIQLIFPSQHPNKQKAGNQNTVTNSAQGKQSGADQRKSQIPVWQTAPWVCIYPYMYLPWHFSYTCRSRTFLSTTKGILQIIYIYSINSLAVSKHLNNSWGIFLIFFLFSHHSVLCQLPIVTKNQYTNVYMYLRYIEHLIIYKVSHNNWKTYFSTFLMNGFIEWRCWNYWYQHNVIPNYPVSYRSTPYQISPFGKEIFVHEE